MSNLHQIQLSYDQQQDRLILVLFTQDWSEFKFWITRRIAEALGKILQQLLKNLKLNEKHQQQETKEIQGKIEQEKAQRQLGAEKYASHLTRKPLGEEPLLISKIMAKAEESGVCVLHFENSGGQSIEFKGDSTLLIALAQLIERSANQADWKIDWHKE
jgi:hypothetical protein